jgi:aldose 1-epimerase
MPNLLITAGKYRAEIRSKGGGLNSLTFKHKNLIDPFIAGEPHRYRGDLLVPWPNRIRDGKYSFQNREYKSFQNEVSRSNALHGLVLENEWVVQENKENSVDLITSIINEESYPTKLEIRVSYLISTTGLMINLIAMNVGPNNAPYGHSIHPYLIADPDSKVDSWILKMPASKYMEVDVNRLLPIGVKSVNEEFNFNSGRRIGKTFIDHAFQIDKSNRNQSVELISPSGAGVGMRYSGDLNWIQIHTADRENGSDSRTCLAVEPMTCPPDAFNSGTDLLHLKPGESHSSTWELFKI